MNIVYIDGHCLICNKLVAFLIKHDHNEKLKFASLQGSYAKDHLEPKYTQDISSVVFSCDGDIYLKSDAAIRVLWLLGGMWKMSLILLFIPKFLRNFIYNFISTNRYRLGRKLKICQLPKSLKEGETKRFLP